MNSISISGNISQDAELRALPDGTQVAAFSIADNMVGRDKGAIFWRCSLFGKRSEALSQYLMKGQQVTVIGNVTEREWQDKDGQKRKSMDVRVSDVALMGGKRDDAPRQAAPRAAPTKPAAAGSGFDDDSTFRCRDDDVLLQVECGRLHDCAWQAQCSSYWTASCSGCSTPRERRPASP